jgi:hypothetical protein
MSRSLVLRKRRATSNARRGVGTCFGVARPGRLFNRHETDAWSFGGSVAARLEVAAAWLKG